MHWLTAIPVQPGRHFRLATKAAQVPKRGQEGLLGRVARLLAAQHPVRERKYAPLPAPHDLAKASASPVRARCTMISSGT